MVIVTLAGADKVKTSSLGLSLLDKNGNHIKNSFSFIPQGKGGVHFLATFSPPLVPFKLLLKGKTKKGYPFKRNSRTIIQAKSAALTLLYTRHDQTIPAGGKSYAYLILHNAGKAERFKITVRDKLGYVKSHTKGKHVRRRGTKTIVVRVRAGSGDKGKTDTVFISATGTTSNVVVSYVLNMLVV
jgi:hypothetical protein